MAPMGDSRRRPVRDTAGVKDPNRPPADPSGAPDGEDLRNLIEAQCSVYADDVRWSAPRRGLVLTGREEVRRHLLAEACAMRAPQVTELRRTAGGGQQTFHEYVVRFHHAQPGIPAVALPLGESAELERLRVLTIDGEGRVTAESSIETWSTLRDGASDA